MISSNTALDIIQISLEILSEYNVIILKEIYRSKGQESLYIKSQNAEGGKYKTNYTRSSNHNTTLDRLLKYGHKPHKANNIGIEFTEKRKKKNGKDIQPLDDKDPKINQVVPKNGKTIRPYLFTVFRYDPEKLENKDIKPICKALVVYVQTGIYNDPFKGTPKEAEIIPRYSEIIPNTREYYIKGKIPEENTAKKNTNDKQGVDESYTLTKSHIRRLINEILVFED